MSIGRTCEYKNIGNEVSVQNIIEVSVQVYVFNLIDFLFKK